MQPHIPRLVSDFYRGQAAVPDTFWWSLKLFNGYRLVAALLLFAAVHFWGDFLQFGSRNLPLFLAVNAAYGTFGVAMFALLQTRERFNTQLIVQVAGDVCFVVLLMYASGGLSSGLGLLLLISLAMAGLVSRGRLTLFLAALATIGVLLEHGYEVINFQESPAQFAQAGLLCVAYFTIAALGHILAQRAMASEELAAQRAVDLANLAQVNQLVIQDMDHGVVVVDGEGCVRQANSAAENILGAQRMLPGMSLKPCSEALFDWFQHWVHEPAPAGRDSLLDISRGLHARLVPAGSHREVGAVIFLSDLDRIQSEARQLKLAALGRLTANIAHEIRNPLGAIGHAAELLAEGGDLASTQRLTAIIRDNTRRLDRMVTNVQTLNRGEKARREAVALKLYLYSFVEQFTQTEKLASDLIVLDMSSDPNILFDRDHLNQVLWNLCRNAVRHSRRQSESVRVGVMPGIRRHTIRLQVDDDGDGVAADAQSKLFEPFYTTAPGGTGLGLYLAREMCEANGATLEYVPMSRGARFVIVCELGQGGKES